MAFKLIWCCSHVIYTYGLVQQKLPQQIYNVLEKSYETFDHVVFLEVCKSYGITLIGFNIKKTPGVCYPSNNFLLLSGKELAAAQFKLIELTITESVQKLFDLEAECISKFSLYTVLDDCLLKTKNHLEKYEKKLCFKRLEKLEFWRVLTINMLPVWNVLRVITNFFV